MSKEELESQKINLLLNCEVTEILPQEKMVIFTKSEGSLSKLSYDKLILAMGSEKFELSKVPIKKENNELITYKTYEDTKIAYKKIKDSHHILIIGGGFIGLELASSLSRDSEKKITVMERMSYPLFRYFDEKMVASIIKNIPQNVELQTNVPEVNLEKLRKLKLFNDIATHADTCVLARNPLPNSLLVKGKVKLDFDKTVMVNEYMQTSDPDIYAIGDLVKIPFMDSAVKYYLPQIIYARKQSFVVATNILKGNHLPYPVSQRTVASEIFGYYVGSCGYTSEEALYNRIKIRSIMKEYTHLSNFGELKDAFLKVNLIVDETTERILGVQLITNKPNILELINVFSTIVAHRDTLMDLLKIDLHFVPKISPLVSIFLDLMLESRLK